MITYQRGGFGSQTAADPPLGTPPPKIPEKQTAGTVTQNAHPASTFELSQCRHCKEGLPGPRRGFWVTPGSLSPKRPRPFARSRYSEKINSCKENGVTLQQLLPT